MNTIDKLTEIFKEFPGIGERQARRFVYFLMLKKNGYSDELIKLVSELKKETSQCKSCFRFFIFQNQNNQNDFCERCSSIQFDKSVLMVLEKDSDLESVEKSRIFNGKFFVLGGLVPVVEKKTKSFVRINELIEKIEKEKKDLKEIILAFSVNPQGNHTDFYVRNELKNVLEKYNIKISSLGRGLSTGTELEYSDNDTIKNALENRH